ncbi:DUF29 domain-containing protein [Methylobacterium pseudosasicola]|uniref:DUF29 domain-containing protein n=1 Tax=Methylobacterium pseudosasicola TaxID=582667 RepID=A0A1I4QJI9_9HYPH|nr:DUF29 domain-containing protein [Methylobacterium pseudosasicola]SFM40221.1 protein of unknown function DUF29 [Methylobacterium pseudosasicola]
MACRAPAGTAYRDDFYAWTQEQVGRLRVGDITGLDRANLAEEIESLGRTQFASLVRALENILANMLTIDHRAGSQNRRKAIEIAMHRKHVSDELHDSPSLKNRLGDAVERAYRCARLEAADTTGLALRHFPEACPYTYQDIMDRPFAIDPDS